MRNLVVTSAALALLVSCAGLGKGEASDKPAGGPKADETIVVVEKQVKFKFLDFGAKGESVGDMMVARNDLFDEEGNNIGRVLTRCLLQFKPDLHCDGVYKLTGRGDIVFSNVVDTADEATIIGPIVGGDGEFANVGGQLSIESRSEDSVTTLTISYND